MPTPQAAVEAVEAFCAARNAPEHAEEMRLEVEVEGNAITLVERRAPWMAGMDWTSSPIARLRFTASRGEWTLQYPSVDGRWRRYEDRAPTRTVEPLLDEIATDPTCIFWG